MSYSFILTFFQTRPMTTMAYGPHKSAQIIQVSVSNSDKISSKRFVPFLLLVDKDKVGLLGQQKTVTSSCRPKRFVFRNLHSSRLPGCPFTQAFSAGYGSRSLFWVMCTSSCYNLNFEKNWCHGYESIETWCHCVCVPASVLLMDKIPHQLACLLL